MEPQNVAAAIIIQGSRVLVARRAHDQNMAGLWEFPGGKLEDGETAEEGIVRELAEELCISCVAGDVFVENLHRYEGGTINLIAVHVTITSDRWQLSVHDDVRWVGPDELLELELAPADIPIAHKLRVHILESGNNGAN